MKRARDRQYQSRHGWVREVKKDVFTTPFGRLASLSVQAVCDHRWERDGQTLMAVRWVCTKCYKSILS